ncbi:TPA: MerR family transcriptional regulator [Campylobacter lari]|uniref:MerR family transcriptional regulator n=1 Tax=Campylobacter lari TaxID=201 RepID=UPI00215396FF|nr:MerR family transcriptional regulator [Campylobacter lari]MCR6558429.1 MerR family transcriptional regulator [Campylobacter lari]MCV3404593.1 MerR family transcriptional regulator [Campylobacter lari]HEC1782002.1 MerR family transcriptional regulator [Campylobacter lari]
MAYTVIEVEKLTGISSHTIRFWAKKNLFPFVYKDKNNVKYFSQKDIAWVEWIACLRTTGMSLEDIKEYIYLFPKGIKTAPRRKELLVDQYKKIQIEIKNLKKAQKKLKHKIEIYERIIQTGVDELNPQCVQYQDMCELKTTKR